MNKMIKVIALSLIIGIGAIGTYAQIAPGEVQTIVLDKPNESKDIHYKYTPRFKRRNGKEFIVMESLLAATISVELKEGTYLQVNPAFASTFPSINCMNTKPYDGIVPTQNSEKPTTASWDVSSKGNRLFSASNGAKLIFVRASLVRDSVMPFFKVPETGIYEIKIFGQADKGFEDKAVIRYSLEEPQNPCVPMEVPAAIEP